MVPSGTFATTSPRIVFHSPCSYAKKVISDLLQNKVDMSQLVITKALSKDSACFILLSVGYGSLTC